MSESEIMADDLVCREKEMRLAPKAPCHLSLGHRPKNSNCRVTSAESAFQFPLDRICAGLNRAFSADQFFAHVSCGAAPGLRLMLRLWRSTHPRERGEAESTRAQCAAMARDEHALGKLPRNDEDASTDFARSAFGVRCVLASLSRAPHRTANIAIRPSIPRTSCGGSSSKLNELPERSRTAAATSSGLSVVFVSPCMREAIFTVFP